MNDLVESEDELLDPQPAPQAAPRTKAAGVLRRWRAQLPFGADSDPRQRRRAVLACGMALALAAGAGAAGVAVHRADLHRDQSRVQSRILLHLLGGGASMTFLSVDGSGHTVVPDRFDIPLATDFAISVRNDGAQPLDIRAVRIKEPGVDVESVTVRTAGSKTRPAGKPTDVALAFDHGSHDSVLPDASDQGSAYLVNSFATNSFYHLCANAVALMPPQVTATVLPSGASPRNPVVRYALHIEGTPGIADIVAPAAPSSRVPGVSVETDLDGTKPVGNSGLDVTVTDRITDCAAFGDYLTSRGGAAVAADTLHSAVPLSLEPADPRFRSATVNRPIGRDEGLFATSGGTVLGALLAELTAACPQL
ncbi:MAG: hypothetical protein AUG49_04330 [Catenulispora sp. 13_1_20CM_3_70_7]|nr:MAG: hypothetical protein AUG49_04330 [Catenulispora sp. 13_1_20CM_3_70_7]